MQVTEIKWPFIFKRRQFLVRLSYVMTVNKSQRQTLKKVGLYLPKSVFSHGQLYITLSRITSHESLKILIKNEHNILKTFTKNIVHIEIFSNLPLDTYFSYCVFHLHNLYSCINIKYYHIIKQDKKKGKWSTAYFHN